MIDLKIGRYYEDGMGNLCQVLRGSNSEGFYIEHFNVYSNGNSSKLYHRSNGEVNVNYNYNERKIIKEISPEDYPELFL